MTTGLLGHARKLGRHIAGGIAASFLLFSAADATEVAVSFRDAGYGTFGGSQLQSIANPASLLALPGISNVEFV